MTTPSKAAISATELYLATHKEYAPLEINVEALAILVQNAIDAETAGLRQDLVWGKETSTARNLRCIELLEELFALRPVKARAGKAVGLARRMHEALRVKCVARIGSAHGKGDRLGEISAVYFCGLCNWSEWHQNEPERHEADPTCLASPEAIKELETI